MEALKDKREEAEREPGDLEESRRLEVAGGIGPAATAATDNERPELGSYDYYRDAYDQADWTPEQ